MSQIIETPSSPGTSKVGSRAVGDWLPGIMFFH
jgi:hypothetical protein